jgi:hypothetical protein
MTTYGVAVEPIFLGDLVVIEDGRVRRATNGDLPHIKFLEGFNNVNWLVQEKNEE